MTCRCNHFDLTLAWRPLRDAKGLLWRWRWNTQRVAFLREGNYPFSACWVQKPNGFVAVLLGWTTFLIRTIAATGISRHTRPRHIIASSSTMRSPGSYHMMILSIILQKYNQVCSVLKYKYSFKSSCCNSLKCESECILFYVYLLMLYLIFKGASFVILHIEPG